MAAGLLAALIGSLVISPEVHFFTLRCVLGGLPRGAPLEILPVLGWLAAGPACGALMGLFGWYAASRLLHGDP